MLCKVSVEVRSLAPLMCHNGQLANPLNKWVREIAKITSKKKNKTDDDMVEMARLEFMGGLYLTKKNVPCIPDTVIEGFFGRAAKKINKGPQGQAGIYAKGEWPLIYDGPKDPDKMWASGDFHDIRGCKLAGKSTVMRCRPIFHKWGLKFELLCDTEIISIPTVKDILDVGRTKAGFGDYIPKFGRFVVVSFEDLGECKIV